MGWIGVDLDGTLAEYHGWVDPTHIGTPIPLMVERVKSWLVAGRDVRIFTARVNPTGRVDPEELGQILNAIGRWCLEQFGQLLPVTFAKDYQMVELWDDRAIQVITNTGRRADGGE